MNLLSFLRKPFKFILCAIIVLCISSVVVLLSLQYYLDGCVADGYIKRNAYIVTVSSNTQKYPMLKTIPDEIIHMMNDSKSVAKTMRVHVYSARAEGMKNVIDCFGNFENLNMKLFVEGVILDEPALYPVSIGAVEVSVETFKLGIYAAYGKGWNYSSILVSILRERNLTASKLKTGDHVFLTGKYSGSSADGNPTGIFLYDPEVLRLFDFETDSPVWNHPIFVLPRDCDKNTSRSLINDFLTETGLIDSFETANDIDDFFTVNAVDDMSMLFSVANETTFITEGRELTTKDIGKKVCVISDAVALKNNVKVGNTIELAISSSCYVYESDFEQFYGWESGFPFEGDKLLDYPEPEKYEIVGIYSEIGRRISALDYIHHTHNDIFIPGGNLPESNGHNDTSSRSLSFAVPGPNYNEFLDEFEDELNVRGFMMTTVDTGWETVSEQFNKIVGKRTIVAICAVAAFFVSVFLAVSLIYLLFRREYLLHRFLGAPHRTAKMVFFAGSAAVTFPALLLSLPVGFFSYSQFFKDRLFRTMQETLPGDGSAFIWISLTVLTEMIAYTVLLWIILLVSKRRCLLPQLKQE